eukprot:11189650-Lingulodinium_polyedra.AAC.1
MHCSLFVYRCSLLIEIPPSGNSRAPGGVASGAQDSTNDLQGACVAVRTRSSGRKAGYLACCGQ